ncbi:MAG: hypothetical protein ABF293_03985, partial [Flavobacteriaceae bacterium]
LCVAFIVFSCSSDDNGGGEMEPSAAVGTWRLTALNINPPQDIDMDGTPTSNILDELPCATGTIIIDEDGSWSSTIQNLAILTVTGDLFEINCSGSSSQSSGAWLLQGNQLTLFRDFSSVIFTLDGDTLTNNSNEDLPGFQSEVYQRQ